MEYMATIDELRKIRLKKLEAMKKAGILAYPEKTKRTHKIGEALKDFNVVTIEESFRKLVEELGIEAKVLIHPIRVALTGKTVGPGLFEVIYCLGKERTKKRLSKFIKGRRP